jgi:hypothetical protein
MTENSMNNPSTFVEKPHSKDYSNLPKTDAEIFCEEGE